MSSLKKNVFYNLLLNVLKVIFPVITVPYISRILSADGIGVVNFTYTYANYFALVAMLGIPTYGIRVIANARTDNNKTNLVFSELLSINIISTILVSSIYLLTIFCVPQLYEQRYYLIIAGICVYLNPFNIDWFFAGQEKFKLITIRSLIVKILSVVLMFVLVRSKEDILNYLLLILISTIVTNIWNLIFVLRHDVQIKLRLSGLKKHLTPIFTLFLSTIAISIYTMLDTLMLGFFSNYTEVGYYTSVIKISQLLLPIVTSVGTVAMSRLAYCNGINDNEQISAVLKRSFGFIALLSVPITVGLIIIAPRFVPFFFGINFIPAIPSLSILAFLVLAIGINNFFGVQILIGLGHDKKFLICVIAGMITNFTLNMCLIPSYGAVGAACGSVIAEAVILFFSMAYAYKVIKINLAWREVAYAFIACIPMIVFAYLISRFVLSDLLYLSYVFIFALGSYGAIQTFIFRNTSVTELVTGVRSKLGI